MGYRRDMRINENTINMTLDFLTQNLSHKMTKIEILTNTKTIFKKKEKFLKFQRKKLFDPFLNFKKIKNKILEIKKKQNFTYEDNSFLSLFGAFMRLGRLVGLFCIVVLHFLTILWMSGRRLFWYWAMNNWRLLTLKFYDRTGYDDFRFQ